MTEFYMGLAAVQAGLLAIVVAAVLVLIQMASQSFSLVTPSFFLRRRLVLLTLILGTVVMAFALAGAIRTAYPTFEALPGNQGTSVFTDTAWPAVGGAIGVVAVLLMSGFLLYQLSAELQGPGLAKILARNLVTRKWTEWLEFAEPNGGIVPPELRQRYEAGALTDPLAPLFEMAVASVQDRRYAVVDPVLGEVRRAVENWFSRPAGDKPNSLRSAARLVSHFNDLLEAALSNQAVTPIESAVRNMEQMALSSISRGDSGFAVRIMDELAHWVGRLDIAGQPGPAAACVHAINSISTEADKAADMATFEQCALALGRAGEDLAAGHKRQPDRLLHADYGDVRHDAPLPALSNAFEAITTHFTQYDRRLKGELHNAKFVVDGLLVAGLALLKAPEFDSHTNGAAGSIVSCLERIGRVAAETQSREVFQLVVYTLEKLPAARQGSDAEFLDTFAFHVFWLGLFAEAEPNASARNSLANRLAALCREAGNTSVESAVGSLYKRGHTGHTPDDVQEQFLRRVESAMGRRFEDRFGISPSEG